MPSLIQGLKNLANGDGRKTVYDKTPTPPNGFAGLSIKEKLQTIGIDLQQYDRQNQQRRNLAYYLVALYYQGYQAVELTPGGNGFDVFQRPDFYVENQFRKDVDTVVGMLNNLEIEPIVRPGSDDPKDLGAAKAGDPAMEMIKEHVAYEQARHSKNLYKALFGTSFQFTDYIVDKRYGTVINPKFRYEEDTDPESGMPLLSKVPDGVEKRSKGSETVTVCSPLEVQIPSDIKGGVENYPWLKWRMWPHTSTVNYAYPSLNADSTMSSMEADLARHYMNVLGALPGNVVGQDLAVQSTANRVELVRSWYRPCEFRNDSELLKQFPDGVHVVMVNGVVIDYYPEDLTDRWTVEKLIVLPHCSLGDGLFDAVMQQDQLNVTNSLMIKNLWYASIGHILYRQDTIDSKDWVNDPEHQLVPVQAALGEPIQNSIMPVNANAMSQDVPAWRASLKESMQDMTSAYDPAVGKSLGANSPYSQSVFLSEKAQGRWKESTVYNQPELKRFWKQLLTLARDNWVDPRVRALKDNSGGWSFQQFMGADLDGNVDIAFGKEDFKPKSRAEQVQAMDQLVQLVPILPMLSPKQKIRAFEMLGMPAESDPISAQIMRAFRMIDRIKKGEMVSPLPMVDDAKAQLPVFQDFLISEQAEDLMMENPKAFSDIYVYYSSLLMMGMAHDMSAAGQFMKPQPQGGQSGTPEKAGEPKQPGGQAGQPGGGNPAGPGQQQAQSPAPVQQPAPPPNRA